MRHIGGAAIGFAGAVLGLFVLGFGYEFALRSVIRLQVDGLYAGVPIMLIGGVLLGATLLAGRLSRAAPLSAGVVLLLVALVSVAQPLAFVDLGSLGLTSLTSQQLVGPFAMVLLVGAFAVRPSAPRPHGAPPYPGPYPAGSYPGGHGPYPAGAPMPYAAGPLGPYTGGPADRYASGPPGPYADGPPDPYTTGPSDPYASGPPGSYPGGAPAYPPAPPGSYGSGPPSANPSAPPSA